MRKGHLVVPVLLCLSVVPREVAAQSAGRIDAAFGYSRLHDYDAEMTFKRGWFASLGADVVGPFGLVGDVSSVSESQSGLDVEFSMRILSFMGGPRIAIPTRHVTPFAQVLFGTTRFTSTYRLPNDTLSDSRGFFSTQFGGGVDIHLVDHVSARLGAHRRRIHTDTYTPTGTRPFTWHQAEWFAGIALR